jgi:putative endonuclease
MGAGVMVERQRLGQIAEIQASRFLEARGYRIRVHNWRCPLGEVDLIADHRQDLVFIEVKSRRSGDYGRPADAVNLVKRRKLSRLADAYMQSQHLTEVNCRFDVVELILSDEGRVEHLNVIEDAFEYTP